VQSQSDQIKEIVTELIKTEQEYSAKQLELRTKLRDLFECGPKTPQRKIVQQVIDMFLFSD
jgi:hypothetical protein